MGVVSLDAIKPGMILAGDIRDRNGRVLLSTGAEITEKHIRLFKMWGIHTASIQEGEKEDSSSKRASEIDPGLLLQAERQTAELFCHHDLAHPFIRELARLVTLEHLVRLEDDGRGG